MKYFLAISICIISIVGEAQQRFTMDKFLNESSEFMSDAYGRPLYMKTAYRVEGTPFFKDAYSPARIYANGRYYNMWVKINLAENTVLYDNNGVDFVTTVPVNKIDFYDSVSDNFNVTFKNGFPTVGQLTTDTYYQVLDSGKATLLKHIGITYKDDKPYNSATTTRIFEQAEHYYIFTGNTLTPTSKNVETFSAILKDRKEEVTLFITRNKLKTNREEDLKKIIPYYNSLFH